MSNLVNIIKDKVGKQIFYISILGSYLYRDTYRDLDIYCLADVDEGYRTKFTNNGILIDLIVINREKHLSDMNFYLNEGEDFNRFSHYAYQIALAEPIYVDPDYQMPEIDIFNEDFKYKYIKNMYNMNVNVFTSINKYRYNKVFIHCYIISKIYMNNSLEITHDMRTDIDMIYNKTGHYEAIIDDTIINAHTLYADHVINKLVFLEEPEE